MVLDRAGRHRSGDFRWQLRARLQRDFAAPPHLQDPDLTGQRADMLWVDAPRYGMVTQSDMTRYCYLMMGLWDDWATSPDQPWISTLLLAKRLSGKDKLDTIYRVMGEAA